MHSFGTLTGWLIVAALLTGCASVGSQNQRAQQSQALNEAFQKLGPTVTSTEAVHLASTAIEHSAELNRRFRPAWPAWFNNMLVNAQLRERGLCYHWTNDLFVRLSKLELQTLELHLAVANRATPREHNTIVVTARGQPFAGGIVLDAWRHGGRLWWGRVADDKKYSWTPMPPEFTPKELRGLIPKQTVAK